MRGREAIGYGQTDLDRPAPRERDARELMAERLTSQKLRNGEADSSLVAEVMDVENVRMGESGDRPGLALEARQRGRVAREILRRNLDGNFSPESGVPGSIDLPHPSRAERRKNLIRAQARALPKYHGGFRGRL